VFVHPHDQIALFLSPFTKQKCCRNDNPLSMHAVENFFLRRNLAGFDFDENQEG